MRRETILERAARRFKAGEIDKWEFYETVRWYRTADVAKAADITPDVVRMRRRDLRAMTPAFARMADAELADAIREQWRKYDEALTTKPHIAIVQINARLVRLENERERREIERAIEHA